jgi:hypothetical protein
MRSEPFAPPQPSCHSERSEEPMHFPADYIDPSARKNRGPQNDTATPSRSIIRHKRDERIQPRTKVRGKSERTGTRPVGTTQLSPSLQRWVGSEAMGRVPRDDRGDRDEAEIFSPHPSCHPEQSEEPMHFPADCIDPSARKQRGPQDDISTSAAPDPPQTPTAKTPGPSTSPSLALWLRSG